MTIKKSLTWEKTQMLLATGGLLVCVYGCIAPFFQPVFDPLSPIALLPGASHSALFLAIALLLGLVALAGVLTTRVRPVGALAAGLIAMGGLSLRSPGARPLFVANAGPLQNVFVQMALLLGIFALFLMVAEWVLGTIRRLLARVAKPWAWRNPLTDLTPEMHAALRETHVSFRDVFLHDAELSWETALYGKGLLRCLLALLRRGDAEDTRPDQPTLQRVGGFLAVAMGAGVVVLFILSRSTQRGQLLFALVAAFFLSVRIAYHLFPIRAMFLAWLSPMVVGGGVYLLAAVGGFSAASDSLKHMPPIYHLLPIDWLTAGAGGALLGFWTGQRASDVTAFETLAAKQEAGELA